MRIDPDPVTSSEDPRVEEFAQLTDMDLRQRLEPGLGIFMAEGHLVISRCAQLGLRFRSVLTERRWLSRLGEDLAGIDVDVLVADAELLRSITGYRVHRGALAAVMRPPVRTVEDVLGIPGDVLVLEDLVDPTNVGLAIRSAVVQGIESVIVSPGCADPLYRRAVKSSMGTVLGCRWARSDDWPATLGALRARGPLLALTPGGERDLDAALASVRRPDVALLLGSEGPGLSDVGLEAASLRVRIPMMAPDYSLNIAAAAAVAAYARARTRNMSG